MNKVEINYKQIQNRDHLTVSVIFDYPECPTEILTPFIEQLDERPEVQQRLTARGFYSIQQQLPEFIKCLYGGNDNKTDIKGNTSTPDYCHCGKRGQCPDEGFPGLCSLAKINGISISPVEMELVECIANDKISKEAANKRRRSINTVNTQFRRLREKLNTLRSPALVKLFMAAGLIN